MVFDDELVIDDNSTVSNLLDRLGGYFSYYFSYAWASWKYGSIHRAAEAGDIAGVQAYLNAGIDIESHDEYNHTPLQCATKSNNLDLVKFLVEDKGADIHVLNKKGENLFHIGAHFSSDSLMSYFKAKGIDINKFNNTHDPQNPLIRAIHLLKVDQSNVHKRMQTIKKLLETGADPNCIREEIPIIDWYNHDDRILKIFNEYGYFSTEQKSNMEHERQFLVRYKTVANVTDEEDSPSNDLNEQQKEKQRLKRS